MKKRQTVFLLFKMMMTLCFLLTIQSLSADVTFSSYFSYTESEFDSLKSLDSSHIMNRQELDSWNSKMNQLVEENQQEEDAQRIRAYLNVAQRDAAYLSFRIKNLFEGSLNPISSQTLALFFPKMTNTDTSSDDPYSVLLAKIVLNKIKERLQAEKQITKQYEIKSGPGYWKGKEPFVGWNTSSWMPWFISSSSVFRLPPPPPLSDPIWKEQLAKVKEASQNLTEEQKKIIYYWAGELKEDGYATGDWYQIAMSYMQKKNVPLEKMLLVRSVLAMALEDASIACFDSKYAYFMLRPSMQDSSIKPFIEIPNHPSYPAGHSTISGAAATVLSYFFPENAAEWKRAANEAGLSRIWAGIHYPLDIQAGLHLGEEVGNVAIEGK
jgi:hypothetical protein